MICIYGDNLGGSGHDGCFLAGGCDRDRYKSHVTSQTRLGSSELPLSGIILKADDDFRSKFLAAGISNVESDNTASSPIYPALISSIQSCDQRGRRR